MNPFQNLSKDNLHHAHLVISDFDSIRDDLFGFFQNELEVSVVGNEFFYFKQYDKFLVDDAREIIDIHLIKTPKEKMQLIVIAFNYTNIQAQNALLKMLEEPKDRTYFFIVAPNRNLFLETVLSRIQVLDIKQKTNSQQLIASNFLQMGIGERIKFIAGLAKDIKDEKETKQTAIDLLSGLEIELESKKDFVGLKSILEAKKFINLSGASVKILLETVALNV